MTRSRQILDRSSDSEGRDGFVAGIWVDVETAKPFLSVLAEAAYASPSDQAFSATAGAGLEGRLDGWAVRGEGRVVEGLSSAYSGSAGEIRHRSVEVLLRLGKRRSASAPLHEPR